MKIGFASIVKNEERRIGACLKDIHDLFDEIVIIDTGSNDRTVELLHKFNIKPRTMHLDPGGLYNLVPAKNKAISQARSPWILNMDADERISRNDLIRLMRMKDDPCTQGYFMRWITHKENRTIEDYKTFLVRNDPRIRFTGHAHANLQVSLRMHGLKAKWLGIDIHHYPEERKSRHKRARYIEQMLYRIRKEPEWIRNNWFLGYTYYEEKRYEEAKRQLSTAAESGSKMFPVECLNSSIVLSRIYLSEKDSGKARETLIRAKRFYSKVKDDFEVRINFRLLPWIEEALHLIDAKKENRIKVYGFGC